jgi:hypothetical protein
MSVSNGDLLMKKYGLFYCVLAITIFGGIVVTAAVLVRGTLAQQPQSQPSNNEEVQIKEALRHGGYRAAAKIKGHYVGTFDPNWDWGQFSLEQLTKNSVAVVVGTPINSKSQLAANGMLITTSYDILVQEVVKGNIALGSIVQVNLPGGSVQFDDGTSAEMQTPGFEHVKQGGKYVLFLSDDRSEANTFLLTGGPQGLFELQGEGKGVKGHGRETDPGVKEARDQDEKTFLQALHQHAQKWPQPGKCCQ